MAALESPWIDSMSPKSYIEDNGFQPDAQPPTVAAFSPTTLAGSSLTSRQRSSVIVHKKSPLLVATPPPITRALAYSHPFILPLNKLAGLLTWTTGDPWQSFLLVAAFWTVVLYSDAIILWAGPILVVMGLMLGMYSRRYSPLSSTARTGETLSAADRKKAATERSTRHHKSLDEIVETLRTFTDRCNIMLGPLLDMTEFLSTQRTATSATTKPALTALFLRILFVTPIWIILTLPPFYIITTRRVVMAVGTIILTYHSQPARVSRVILWRSVAVRRICTVITGLQFAPPTSGPTDSGKISKAQGRSNAMNIATRRRGDSTAIRFTFIIYENQRRWLGIGWTYSLFPTERSAWTDEHLNPVPPKDDFELPEVSGGTTKWRWVEGSEWRIEGAEENGGKANSKASDGGGWIYYDNKWNDGRRAQDGWDRYTRRRKWYRDAELVEISPSGDEQPADIKTVSNLTQALKAQLGAGAGDASTTSDTETASIATSMSSKNTTARRRWFSNGVWKNQTTSATATSDASPDIGTTTALSKDGAPGAETTTTTSRPVSIHHHSRRPSNYSGRVNSFSSSLATTTTTVSDSASIREKEIAQAQDHLDRWGARAAGGTERAEREFGLSDDVNMALS